MKIGFIGLGNVGAKLAGSLLRAGFELSVRDLDRSLAQPFLDQGAHWAESPADMAAKVEFLSYPACPRPRPCGQSWKARTAPCRSSARARSGWR